MQAGRCTPHRWGSASRPARSPPQRGGPGRRSPAARGRPAPPPARATGTAWRGRPGQAAGMRRWYRTGSSRPRRPGGWRRRRDLFFRPVGEVGIQPPPGGGLGRPTSGTSALGLKKLVLCAESRGNPLNPTPPPRPPLPEVSLRKWGGEPTKNSKSSWLDVSAKVFS